MKRLSLLISIFLLSLISCQKGPGSPIVDMTLMVHIESPEGVDLLNPASDGAIVPPFLQIYGIVDGKKKRQHTGMTINKYEGLERYYLHLVLNDSFAEKGRFMYILEYKDRKPDTITAEVDKKYKNSLRLKDVKVNGKPFPQKEVLITKDE